MSVPSERRRLAKAPLGHSPAPVNSPRRVRRVRRGGARRAAAIGRRQDLALADGEALRHGTVRLGGLQLKPYELPLRFEQDAACADVGSARSKLPTQRRSSSVDVDVHSKSGNGKTPHRCREEA